MGGASSRVPLIDLHTAGMADYPGLPHTRFSSGNIAQTLTSSSQSRTTPKMLCLLPKLQHIFVFVTLIRHKTAQWTFHDQTKKQWTFCPHLDKAPPLTIRRVIWIFASDTQYLSNSNKSSTNSETAMLSSFIVAHKCPISWAQLSFCSLRWYKVLCCCLLRPFKEYQATRPGNLAKW